MLEWHGIIVHTVLHKDFSLLFFQVPSFWLACFWESLSNLQILALYLYPLKHTSLLLHKSCCCMIHEKQNLCQLSLTMWKYTANQNLHYIFLLSSSLSHSQVMNTNEWSVTCTLYWIFENFYINVKWLDVPTSTKCISWK